MPDSRITVEICVDSRRSVQHALRGGADRLELCADLDQDGLTPTAELLASTLTETQCPVFAMLRPRAGDFCYADEALEIERDFARLRETGVAGFVFGALTVEERVDTRLCRRVIQAAGDRPVTFHRAFDRVRDWRSALEEIIDLGFTRILTSGGAPSAVEGIPRLRQLVEIARDRITILPGGGVRAANVEAIVQGTGASEVHLSGRTDSGEAGNSGETDEEEVRAVVTRLMMLGSEDHRAR